MALYQSCESSQQVKTWVWPLLPFTTCCTSCIGSVLEAWDGLVLPGPELSDPVSHFLWRRWGWIEWKECGPLQHVSSLHRTPAVAPFSLLAQECCWPTSLQAKKGTKPGCLPSPGHAPQGWAVSEELQPASSWHCIAITKVSAWMKRGISRPSGGWVEAPLRSPGQAENLKGYPCEGRGLLGEPHNPVGLELAAEVAADFQS